MKELHTDEERKEYLRRQETVEQYLSAILKVDKTVNPDNMQDKMTGLHNIKGFYYCGTKLLAMYPDSNFAIVRLNFYNFKLINEYIGRAAGDKLIQFVATKLNDVCQDERWEISHFRADDFALLMPYEDISEVDSVVDEIYKAICNYPISCKLLPAFGICTIDDHAEHMDAICDNANIAIDLIKGNVLFYKSHYTDKLKEKIKEQKKIENRMNEAIALHEFVPYLQPKVDLRTGKVVGAEALVRWITPDDGIVPPSRYMKIFEKNGFVINMDEAIWERVFETIRRWLDRGEEVFPISVNVSRIHSMEENFAERCIALARKYQVDPKYIKLELTEESFSEESSIFGSMKLLRENGFLFSMDDFGCGFSSLNMLQEIDIDEVKLDRGFISTLGKNEKSNTIISYMIGMLVDLGIDIIAEGVETEEQRKFLLEHGCYQAQGFLFYKPMPIEEFEVRFITKKES